MPFRIATRIFLVTTHHSHYAGTFHFREGRTAFYFRYFTASDEAPLQYFHNLSLKMVQRYEKMPTFAKLLEKNSS
jgi:hypothetical protein